MHGAVLGKMCYTLSQTHLWEDMCSYIEHTGLSNQSSCIWTPALSAVCAFKVFPLCIWTSQSINGSASVSQESCIFGFASAGQAPTKTWTFHGCSPKSSSQSQQKAWSAHFTALAKVGPPLLKITWLYSWSSHPSPCSTHSEPHTPRTAR